MYSADGGPSAPPPQPAITYASSSRPGSASSAQGRASSGSTNRVSSVVRRAAKKQQTAVKDTSGTVLLANDATGFGLKRPYLLWHVYSSNLETSPAASPTTSTTSGTFVNVLTVANEPQHPLLRVRVLAVTGAATSGEVRLVDRTSGTVLAGPLVVGIAASVEANLDATLVAPTLSGAGAPYKVDVQARITAGANPIGVLVVYAIGIGS